MFGYNKYIISDKEIQYVISTEVRSMHVMEKSRFQAPSFLDAWNDNTHWIIKMCQSM